MNNNNCYENNSQSFQENQKDLKTEQLDLADKYMSGSDDTPVDYYKAYELYKKWSSEKVSVAHKKFVEQYLEEQKELYKWKIVAFYENYDIQKENKNIEKIKIIEKNFNINKDYKKILKIYKTIKPYTIDPFISWKKLVDNLPGEFSIEKNFDLNIEYSNSNILLKILRKHLRTKIEETSLDELIQIVDSFLEDIEKNRKNRSVKDNTILFKQIPGDVTVEVHSIEDAYLDATGKHIDLDEQLNKGNEIF